MRFTIETLPKVHPMMVRRIAPVKFNWYPFRDKVLIAGSDEIDVDEIGLAESRLLFDSDVVDQGGAVFELTSSMMMTQNAPDIIIGIFTSRRWRNHRWEQKNEAGFDMEWPTKEEPLLFIGNPYFVERFEGEIIVHRESSYLIKSGAQLQHEAEISI